MFEIAIVSGKGGTGKTTISSSLLTLFIESDKKVLGVDADIEAPDLILAMGGGKEINREEIWQSVYATINYEECINCLECYTTCQFKAITIEEGFPKIIKELCEGCKTCSIVCPTKAITYITRKTGDVVIFDNKITKIVTGYLEIGMRNSGLMVDIIREKAWKIAQEEDYEGIIIDSAPGIGCPVISSLKGVNYAILVLEPTPMSLKAATRIIEITKHFGIKTGIVVNKFDIYESYVKKIEKWVAENNLTFLGKIPFSEKIPEAYNNLQPVIKYYPESNVAEAIREIYNITIEEIGGE